MCLSVWTILHNTRFVPGDSLHCKDRADGGIKHVWMYRITGGPHKDQLYPCHIHEYFLESSRHKNAANSICQTSSSQVVCIRFVPSQLSVVCSPKFEPTGFELKVSLKIESGAKLPLNMFKEGSVLPDNTDSACEAIFYGLQPERERRGRLLAYPGPSESERERKLCAIGPEDEMREQNRSKHFM